MRLLKVGVATGSITTVSPDEAGKQLNIFRFSFPCPLCKDPSVCPEALCNCDFYREHDFFSDVMKNQQLCFWPSGS